NFLRVGAPRMEPARRGRIDEIGREPVNRKQLLRLEVDCRREERLRVWMDGRPEHITHSAELDELPRIHDCQTIAHLAHDPEVLGDEDWLRLVHTAELVEV